LNKHDNILKRGITDIKSYVPGRSIDEIALDRGLDPSTIIKLGSNENPLGPSKKAVEAVMSQLGDMYIYPSADAIELVTALSSYTGIDTDSIVASGPGMDGLIDGLLRLVLEPGDNVIITTPTFSYYEIASRANGAIPIFVKRDSNFNIDINEIRSSISDKTKFIFLCSPNNPSGNTIPEDDIKIILESTESLVFVDEAYIEFADRDVSHLLKDYDNLVIGRTFSKAFGLAGLRIGYGLMPPWLKSEYMKVSTPFNVSSVAIAGGIAALNDKSHLNRSQEMVQTGRKFLQHELPFKVYDSQANFVLVDVYPYTASEVSEHLLNRGIIVRDCTSFRDAGDSLIRVTVGTNEQNKKLVTTFRSFLGN